MSLLFNVDQVPVQRNESLEARRYGKVIYTKAFLETAPEVVQKLYSKIVPVSVTYDFARELFEVVALCPEFDPVEPAYIIPFYAVNIKRYKRKSGTFCAYYIDFIRVDAE